MALQQVHDYDETDYQWRYTFSQVHKDEIEDLSLDQDDFCSDDIAQCDGNVIEPLRGTIKIDEKAYSQTALNNIVLSLETSSLSTGNLLA
ncbi:MAG: hypothetical protein IJ838_00010 [Paludibacteraceae bacterium]|nr:hypothetical protein [Paludibacteraceae bacterium]